ncbi:hypothetical protein ONS95_005061 [Cadophora gregata]|uniref:uncharacterized protein n=1 Tax=Cadophora gregata TaxID=51156 RepID=UPI0026DD75C9|nr:uncharacterized protein ONS95_005061 [Cadophora gregata]KAK0104792.1 hypothetical protein ONS95_005061 [Cadophora gregata]
MITAMAPTAPDQLWTAVRAIHYGFPALVSLYFLVTLAATVCTLQTRQLRVQDQPVRRDVMLGLIFAVALTYLLETFTTVLEAFFTGNYPAQDLVIYLIASTIFFGVQCLALTDSKFPVWYPYFGTWFIGIAVELVLLVVPNVFDPPKHPFDFAILVIQIFRTSFFIILPSLYFGLRNDNKLYEDSDVERQALLKKKLGQKPSSEASTLNENGYGTTTDNSQDSDTADNASDTSGDSYLAEQRKMQARIDKRLEQDGNWFAYAKGFTIFFPYVWPYHNRFLQFRAVLVGFCLLATNALNVLVPNQMGVMIDSLTSYHNGDKSSSIWLPIAIYAALRFVSGGAGIGWLKTWLWMPLEQYSYNALSTAAHAHLMSLSSDFHENKNSSDLTQAVHGGRTVTDLLDIVCFQVVPMFIDLAIAFAYLWSLFGAYMGLIMVSTVVSYLYITTKLYSRRAGIRRDFITIFRREWTLGQQSLDGWSTASLFNMIPYEQERYSGAVKDHMKSKGAYEMSSQAIIATQALILTLGLLGALGLGVYQVAYEGQSVGKFTTLLVYWGQLQSPLTFFSTMYKQISYSLMDAEQLLELFRTKPSIVDAPDAKPLKLGDGVVKFNNVSFAYDQRKPTLANVSFNVPSGKTVALVGETGGGKSTILKLIDRFYEVTSGSISIDDQDIRQVTLDSLRERIGVVPQEPMLFNDTIMNNIRYARLSASDQEVHEACRAAVIHDKIESFPDGYNSKVGDRGVKLSGGEKQRVAIARAILKRPDIILLDEATSAVDTETEQLIQEGFKTLCQGRTTIVVAHRLSTIMKADHIVVVMNGKVVEQGSHDELIHTNGKYHDLWSKQIFVKPIKKSRSRSRSPQKRDASIINDLTPSRQRVELVKAMKTTRHEEPKKDEVKPSVDGDKPDTETKIEKKIEEIGHKREGSKLKPDAPEFVPGQSVSLSLPTTPISKAEAKEAVKAQKKQEKEERKIASLTKKAEKKAAKAADRHGMDGNASIADESQSAGISNDIAEGEISRVDKPGAKRTRSSIRRHQTKSEPANRPNDSLDGQQDLDMTPVSSGEGQPLLPNAAAQRRRVSAPSDPPAQQETRNTRHRRNRHWRLKNRNAEKLGAGSGSTASSSGTSMDDIPGPPPPLPSPAAGIPQKSSAPKVSFAMP